MTLAVVFLFLYAIQDFSHFHFRSAAQAGNLNFKNLKSISINMGASLGFFGRVRPGFWPGVKVTVASRGTQAVRVLPVHLTP